MRMALTVVMLPLATGCAGTSPLEDADVMDVGIRVLSEARFTRILDVGVTREAVWVLSDDPHDLARILRADGSVQRGQARGEGPGKLATPLGLGVTGEGDALVVDPYRRTALRYDGSFNVRDGQWPRGARPVSRRLLADVAFQSPFRVETNRLGQLAFTPSTDARFPGDMRTGDVNLVNSEGGGVRWAMSLKGVARQPVHFLGADPLWAACARGGVWFDGVEWLTWYSEAGLVGRVRIPLPQHTLSHAFAESFLEQVAWAERPDADSAVVRAAARSARRSTPNLVPRKAPRAVGLACAGDIALLGLFDDNGDPMGRGSLWLAVDSSGVVGRFQVPGGFRALEADDGVLVGALSDGRTGLEALVLVELGPMPRSGEVAQ